MAHRILAIGFARRNDGFARRNCGFARRNYVLLDEIVGGFVCVSLIFY